MPTQTKGSAKKRKDFEEYLIANHMDGFSSEQIGEYLNQELQKHLSKGVDLQIDGALIRRVRNPDYDLNPRTKWRVWVATGRKVRSLKPPGINPFLEWLFERNLTEREFAEKIGMPEGTVRSTASRGSKPTGPTRQKLYDATGLKMFASDSVEDSTSSPPENLRQKPPLGGTSPQAIRKNKPTQHSSEANNGSKVLESLSNREIAARALRGLAELLEGRNLSSSQVPDDFNVDGFDEKSVENFLTLLDLIEQHLDYWSNVAGDEVNDFINSLDFAKVLKIGTGLTSITRESSFASWKQHRVKL